MRALCLSILLAAAPVLCLADAEARGEGDDFVRITARPCVSEAVLARIPDAGERLDYRAGVGRFAGRDHALCWKPFGAGVWLVWDDGDAGFLPAGALKPVPAA